MKQIKILALLFFATSAMAQVKTVAIPLNHVGSASMAAIFGQPSIAVNMGEPRITTENVQALFPLPEGIITCIGIEESDMLIVKGTPEAIDKLIELVKILDIPVAQVKIECTLCSISSSEANNAGIAWNQSNGLTTAPLKPKDFSALLGKLYHKHPSLSSP